MRWERAVAGLDRAVVRHLGEVVTVSEGTAQLELRGVLTDPERLAQLARADFVMAEAMLTLQSSEAPSWLARGCTVTRASGTTYDVVRVLDNGEGLLEVTLCRS